MSRPSLSTKQMRKVAIGDGMESISLDYLIFDELGTRRNLLCGHLFTNWFANAVPAKTSDEGFAHH